MQIMMGCDPEIFIRDTLTGSIISGEGIVPGTKRHPHKVECGALQLDGLALEFNIDPVDNEKDWIKHITVVLGECKDILPKNTELAFLPSVQFDKKTFATFSPKSLELGCDPDYNAISGERNPVPQDPGHMRTASGHIHIGFVDKRRFFR